MKIVDRDSLRNLKLNICGRRQQGATVLPDLFFSKLGFTSPCALPFKVSDDDLSKKQKHAYISVKKCISTAVLDSKIGVLCCFSQIKDMLFSSTESK